MREIILAQTSPKFPIMLEKTHKEPDAIIKKLESRLSSLSAAEADARQNATNCVSGQ